MSQPLALRAYDALKQDILSCVLRPGEMVIEANLAERYEMSKTPVREALSLLSKEGLVQTVPRRGTLITPITVTDIQHTYYLRMLLEPEAAALAAQRISPAQLDQLRAIHEERAIADAPGSEILAPQANLRFHVVVAEASGIPPLATMLTGVLEKVERFYNGHPSCIEPAHHNRNHAELIEVLEQHDHEGAKSLVTESVRRSRQHLLASLIEDPTALATLAAAAT